MQQAALESDKLDILACKTLSGQTLHEVRPTATSLSRPPLLSLLFPTLSPSLLALALALSHYSLSPPLASSVRDADFS